VLTSAVLPPRAEEQVVDALKHLDPDGNVPVITVPPLLEPPEPRPVSRRGVLALITRRRTVWQPSYDIAAVMARIEEALREARDAKERPRIRPVRLEPSTALIVRSTLEMGLEPTPASNLIDYSRRTPISIERKRVERSRRFAVDELPGRCTLTTPSGLIVRMLNVSSSGVLFESPMKFARESETLLSLLAPQAAHVLPARIVRSDVAGVTSLGVTYQTAAQFSGTLEFLKSVAAPAEIVESAPPARIVAAAPPHSLSDLLIQVTTELYQHEHSEAARATFEAGLQHLVPGCYVTLSERLVEPADGADSIYLAVPGESGMMLHATFEPGHEPTAEDLKLLRAAAAMASIVVNAPTRALIRRTA
jgi:hypothetical protein